RRAQPDGQRPLPDRPDQGLRDGPAARLENTDPDRRRQRAGKLRQLVQRYSQLSLAVVVGRWCLDVAAVAGKLLANQTELEVGIVREGVVVEGDHRLGLDPQVQ